MEAHGAMNVHPLETDIIEAAVLATRHRQAVELDPEIFREQLRAWPRSRVAQLVNNLRHLGWLPKAQERNGSLPK